MAVWLLALQCLPWLLLVVVVPLLLVRRLRLSSFAPLPAGKAPFVSVIVPARNEADNISACLATLFASSYPAFEIIVVDDGSTDGTHEIVRILEQHGGGKLTLVTGAPLPEGWMGKPWACWQGYERAKGELLLFTDADTRHDDMLLGHAVGALHARKSDLVSILPRQLMVTFWENMIQPQIFTLLSMRYHDLERINRTRKPRHGIANGQFILVTREAYDAIGGHQSLKHEVVEDQRFAQRMIEEGRRIFVAYADDVMETRMYRSLSGIVEGWSKNIAIGSRNAAPAWLGPAVPWLIVAFLALIWVAPPATLITSFFYPIGAAARAWSIVATSFSLIFWLLMLAWMRVPLPYAAGYPLGAIMTAWLVARSALKGSSVEWRGRRYEMTTSGTSHSP